MVLNITITLGYGGHNDTCAGLHAGANLVRGLIGDELPHDGYRHVDFLTNQTLHQPEVRIPGERAMNQ